MGFFNLHVQEPFYVSTPRKAPVSRNGRAQVTPATRARPHQRTASRQPILIAISVAIRELQFPSDHVANDRIDVIVLRAAIVRRVNTRAIQADTSAPRALPIRTRRVPRLILKVCGEVAEYVVEGSVFHHHNDDGRNQTKIRGTYALHRPATRHPPLTICTARGLTRRAAV